jgi:hypothetical protein
LKRNIIELVPVCALTMQELPITPNSTRICSKDNIWDVLANPMLLSWLLSPPCLSSYVVSHRVHDIIYNIKVL